MPKFRKTFENLDRFPMKINVNRFKTASTWSILKVSDLIRRKNSKSPIFHWKKFKKNFKVCNSIYSKLTLNCFFILEFVEKTILLIIDAFGAEGYGASILQNIPCWVLQTPFLGRAPPNIYDFYIKKYNLLQQLMIWQEENMALGSWVD